MHLFWFFFPFECFVALLFPRSILSPIYRPVSERNKMMTKVTSWLWWHWWWLRMMMTRSTFSSPQTKKAIDSHTRTHTKKRKMYKKKDDCPSPAPPFLISPLLSSLRFPFSYFNWKKKYIITLDRKPIVIHHRPSYEFTIPGPFYNPRSTILFPSLLLPESAIYYTFADICALRLPLCFFLLCFRLCLTMYVCFVCVSVPVHPSYLQLNHHKITTP